MPVEWGTEIQLFRPAFQVFSLGPGPEKLVGRVVQVLFGYCTLPVEIQAVGVVEQVQLNVGQRF